MTEEILPKSVGKLTKEECAGFLQKALALSKIPNRSELARLAGLSKPTVSNYFRAIYLPPQENWNTLREYLVTDGVGIEIEDDNDDEVVIHSKKIKALIYVLKDELNFFKDQPDMARETLKKYLDPEETGYTISLFKALFNEEELDIWKAF